MTRLSLFGWPETGLLSGGDTGPCPISRGHLRPQSFDYEPEAGRQFEEPEAGIEPPQVLGEVRGDDKGKSIRSGPCGDDHAEGGKSWWDVTRLEKQVAASGGCQAIEQQADVVGVKTGEIQPPQRLGLFCPEDAQVIGTVQQPQSGQRIEIYKDSLRGIDEPHD